MSYTSVAVATWAFRLIRIGLFRAIHHGAMIYALQFRVKHITSDDMSYCQNYTTKKVSLCETLRSRAEHAPPNEGWQRPCD
jgi:hypothetical protein